MAGIGNLCGTRDISLRSSAFLFTKDPDRFAALNKKLEQLRADKDSAEERWLEVAEKAEALA